MSAILLLLMLWPAAQAPQAPVPPGPPTHVRPAPRDQQTPAQTGTAVIKGRVLAGDTGRPLGRAESIRDRAERFVLDEGAAQALSLKMVSP